MADDVTIPKSAYRSLLSSVKRGIEVCEDIARLRFMLRSLATQAPDRKPIDRAITACEDVARLRVELSALERRLIEIDQELTPVRPPSRADIKAAFDNSVDFAHGKKKPPSQS